ncbi:SRPBCC family protein [Plantactinospora sp. CA-290183]|uniref:SRPBCC family protein n=1 Tax=Plantactinospora sp. CA-290183 TaxID=3240006 RepID=UPI003D9269EA
MARQDIDVTVRTAAAPATVYALLTDGATWPTWSPLGSFALERPAADEPEGVGAIRVFRTGRVTSRERVAERVPGRRFSYQLLSGLPLRDYRADVDLTPDGEGTLIRWRSSFRARVPGTGWIYRRALTRFIRDCAQGLAARATGSPPPG